MDTNAFMVQHQNTTCAPVGHGFGAGSVRSYYAIPSGPDDLVQFLTLDTTNVHGGAGGHIPNAQWNWLVGQLRANSSRYLNDDYSVVNQPSVKDKLVVIFCHHTLATMDNQAGDRIDNPLPPPIYLAHYGPALKELLLHYPNVILLANGHTHANRITPYQRPANAAIKGGFWEVNTAAHIDWPVQSRILEIASGGAGDTATVSNFSTVIDVDAPLGWDGGIGPKSVASVGRGLAANDPFERPQVVGGTDANGQPIVQRRGAWRDRNTQLLVPAPFPLPQVPKAIAPNLYYAAKSGIGSATATAIGDNGVQTVLPRVGLFTKLQSFGLSPGWTHITPAGGNRLLFYRASDGTAVTGSISPAGAFTSPQGVGGFLPGWTHIVPVDGSLLFYRASDGVAATGIINTAGAFTNLKVFNLPTGWTHIVPAGAFRLLFYRANDGNAVTATISPDGVYIGLQTVGGFVPGWSHIAAAGDKRLVFYRNTDGLSATGVVNLAGAFTNLQVFGDQLVWTHIVTTHT